MTSGSIQAVQQGFTHTCWRGIRFSHPAEWEPAILSGPKEPGRCTLVDRRFQRMQLHWEILKQPPDLRAMYGQLRRSHSEHPVAGLTGVAGWTGLVRKEPQGHVVHAGRYFQDSSCLVQAVFVSPGGRDSELERNVLQSIAPQAASDPALWQALGLTVHVPAAFELTSAKHLVGRVEWEFRRSARPAAVLTVERMGMLGFWLKQTLGEWLAAEQPKGFRIVRESPVSCGGHDGYEVVSWRAGVLAGLVGRGEHRLDRAWRCPGQARVYRLACQRRAPGEIDWPAGLEVHCCRRVKMFSGVS